MLLHSAEKNIDEDGVSSVLSAAGVEVDGARVKALVTSLGDVDIGEAMATAVAAPVAAAPAAAGGGGGDVLLLLRKHQLRKKKRKKPVASKASDLSSVEANSKLTHTLRTPLSGGYLVVRMLAASKGGRRETAHPSLVQTAR